MNPWRKIRTNGIYYYLALLLLLQRVVYISFLLHTLLLT